MDDEGGVKAPVTRLRRRLSVEQSEEVKSSPAANTPTKKRGGRRAAKPELDLIDENASDNNNTSKRTTRKTVVKELEDVEEKPLTPSRRSARIRSNTSIVSETTQTFDSPRAKRAARRISQVGSDNEAPLTPARQTRKARKDSASNVENVENPPAKPITETIVEEEKFQESPIKSNEQNNSPSGSRKSPRLRLKKNKNSNNKNSNDTSEHIDTNSSEDHNTSNKENETSLKEPAIFIEKIRTINVSNVVKNNLSESNLELLQNLKTEPDKKTLTLNKSTSAVTDKLEFKTKRHRTKSWTTLSAPVLNENVMCFSDSETVKNKRKSTLNSSNTIVLENSSNTQKINSSLKKTKNFANDPKLDSLNTSNENENDKMLTHSRASTNIDAVTSLFEREPSTTTIFVEETDSNPEKNIENIKNTDEDQCVPVVEPHYKEESKNDVQVNFSYTKDKHEKIMSGNQNDSCEPMDIDETIPDSLSHSKTETPSNKESISKEQVTECSYSKGGKKRESSITPSKSQILEKSSNENKSTLVLSQLKDISNDNNVPQSSQIFTEKIANSDRGLDTTQDDNGLEKKNSLTAYSTSTPLHQKGLMKLVMNINTSDMTSNNTSKIEKNCNKVNKKKSSNVSNKSCNQPVSDEESEEESEQEESKLIDDEAEEASDDYESGDSKDEEQEQYEKENEIVHKGETLTSEDEISNDTDYEKDSFVVSSDEEDEDLLDGSGDDLSMSDNELKMTKESKKKYNERKVKEQKKASKEMFESRHKLNVSKESIKSESLNKKKKRAVIDSSVSEDDDIKVKVKKNSRMRLDSSHETSTNKSLYNGRSDRTEAKSLSNSINNKSASDEIEMTIYDENSNNDLDPLSIGIKKEPVTPQISKNANVSINFVDPTNSIDNEDNQNKSHTNKTYIDDPLDDSNTSTSDSSDNIHIQNYDSVLNELNNNTKNKKKKSADISLNLHKKTKQKTMPIIDELNLTQVKTKKQKQIQNKDEVDAKINKSVNENLFSKNKPNNEDNDESSDSIDIHLLFSEDSNCSENLQNKKKNNEVESFIPLKQSPGKTNFLEISGSKCINASNKKKKELNKTLGKTECEEEKGGTDEDVEIQFIMDTTGTHNSTEIEKTFNVNTKENKIKQFVNDDDNSSDSDPPAEVSNKSLKEQARKEIENNDKSNGIALLMHSKSITKTPKSEKKNKREKKISESLAMHEGGAADTPSNESLATTPASVKKKRNRLSESQLAEQMCASDSYTTLRVNINTSTAERPDAQNIENQNKEIDAAEKAFNKSLIKTSMSDKKKEKKKTSECRSINISTSESLAIQENENIETEKSMNDSIMKTPKSEKKKKKKLSESQSAEQIRAADTPSNESLATTPASVKKKRNRLSESQLAEQMCASDSYTTLRVNINTSTAERPDAQNIENQNTEIDAAEKAFNKSLIKTSMSDKKKEKKKTSECRSINISTSESLAIQENENIETEKSMNDSIMKTPKSEKKKKKKLSESQSGEQIRAADTPSNESLATTPASVKKKRNRLSESQLAEQMCASDSYTTLRVNINTSTAERPDAQNIEDQNTEIDAAEKAFNKSLIKTPMSDKKKGNKKSSECRSINISTSESLALQENENIETDKSMNHSIMKTPKSEKKKKKKLSESQTAEQITSEVTNENDHNNMLSTSNTSNIQVSSLKEEPSNGSMADKSLTKTPKSEKKKAKTLDTVSSNNIVKSVMEFSDKSATQKSINPVDDTTIKEHSTKISAKKRKRKSSHNQTDGEQDEGNATQITTETLPELSISEIQNKRRKISHNTKNPDGDLNLNKDILAVQQEQGHRNTNDKDVPHNQVNFERGATGTDKSMTMKKEIKKRKQREDDEEDKRAKVQRLTSPEKAMVPRLPTSILNKLEDKPKKKNFSVTKSKLISTSNFIVEDAKTVKNKPSNYLEESIYLNEDELLESKKQKRIKNPKVLPFLPTVSTSISGYTTNFKVNVIPKEFKFIAKSSNVSNFKNDFLENKKIKRLGTYELYKKNRNVKLSKF